MSKKERRQITFDEWVAEGEKRFGDDRDDWKFQCVMCMHVQSANEARARKPDVDKDQPANWLRGTLAMNCEGRLNDSVGCDWSLGGLFRLHTLEVIVDGEDPVPVFEFADSATMD